MHVMRFHLRFNQQGISMYVARPQHLQIENGKRQIVLHMLLFDKTPGKQTSSPVERRSRGRGGMKNRFMLTRLSGRHHRYTGDATRV